MTPDGLFPLDCEVTGQDVTHESIWQKLFVCYEVFSQGMFIVRGIFTNCTLSFWGKDFALYFCQFFQALVHLVFQVLT